ncbi:MAG: hypothetical protein GY819_17260 [Planctomycetaceae bacterium]|nr:hypothetical protein [Planctomycetaceae bacterium]MCP4464545.1 hypothetical protein [Planctomycetaceae bacterium]MDG1809742.1 hypothetical protein [Pirellulaceae bacterium]MDG2102353.1 hypothetical protein [Pirellulaceae bacterium]
MNDRIKNKTRIMLTDQWLSSIGAATQTVFWAIGYLFGFSLVTALSLGLIVPRPFEDMWKLRTNWRMLLDANDGKFHLASEVVTLAGWAFLGLLTWLAFAWMGY